MLRLLKITSLSVIIMCCSFMVMARGGHSGGHSEGHSSESSHNESHEGEEESEENPFHSEDSSLDSVVTEESSTVSHIYTGSHSYMYIPRPLTTQECQDWNSETGVCSDTKDGEEVFLLIFLVIALILLGISIFLI